MPRRFQSGFETGDATLDVTEWGGASNLTNFSFDTGVVNPGGGLRSGKFTGQGFIRSHEFLATVGLPDAWYRFYFRIDGTVTTNRAVVEILGVDGTVQAEMRLKASPDANKVVWRNTFQATDVFTTAAAVSTDEWHLVEWRVASSSTSWEIWLDGVLQFKGNGNTQNSQHQRIQFGPSSGTIGCNIWFDDVAVNQRSAGGLPSQVNKNGGMCGPGAVVNVVPSADSTPSDWTVVGGGSSSFAVLDDMPGTVDTTTYIETTSATNGFEDRWEMGNLPATIDGSEMVNAVMFGVRGGATATTTNRQAKLTVRDAAGNSVDGQTIDWNVNGWKTIYPMHTLETEIVGSADLFKTYVDGLLAAAVEVNTSTRNIRWTAVWASVDVQKGLTAPMTPSAGVFGGISTTPDAG